MRVAILASGNGTNFEALARQFATGAIPGNLVLLFCNHPDAPVMKRAARLHVPAKAWTVKECGGKEAYEQRLLALLQDYQVDFVILAGYLRVVGPTILNAYPHSIVNLHPALLPHYKGLHAIERAFADFQAGRIQQTGVTVHFIDDQLDHGENIAQRVVPIKDDDTAATLEARIHKTEHQLFPQAVKEVLQQRMSKGEK
ncbi:phosphoribosylglycinamide formyltransferase [uncultured Limosilactobacillus sp.]|uniref:phosphoribosylglycinamide formyltransferase n=1 Tax=uncultured Limosilactobacillus sp. TaxID=2837629 RepID=UPI0025F743BF|nr:phosphoribosylglycinamide formyltransferase [uncultured Limosilactobacillus sp.]